LFVNATPSGRGVIVRHVSLVRPYLFGWVVIRVVERRGSEGFRRYAQRSFDGDEQMSDTVYHPTTTDIARRRKELAPAIHDAFESFSRAVFAEGALPEKTKQLIAVAVAHVTQCPYCIAGHTKLARRKGASPEEIMESIWVAAEMRAGGAYAHSTLALHALGEPHPDGSA
jgi:AhpD family alkylhydroperoxidase